MNKRILGAFAVLIVLAVGAAVIVFMLNSPQKTGPREYS